MERDKIMSDRLTAPKELATEQKDVPAVRPTVIHNQNEETQRRQNEFAAVRAIQNSPAFADALRTPRDIEAINNDYITFGVNLAAMVGVQKPIDDSGLFTPDTQRVIGLFLDQTSPEGEKLRSAAKGNGIVAPSNEELTSLRRITKIRSVQKNRFAADGRGGFTPISTEEAFAIAQREAPQLFTVKSAIDERRADQERMQKAVENRSKFTTDVPPSVGADMSNLLKASIDDFVRVIAKPQSSWTVSEMALVKETMKASGLSDEEQKFWIENQKK
jgi:hypothetical protein